MSWKNNTEQDNTIKRNPSPEENSLELAEEQKAHQEHLRRLRKYKKKHKQQIVGLALELLLLVVVIGGYMAISWGQKVLENMRVTTAPSEASTLAPQTLYPGESTTLATDVSGETIRTTAPTTTIEQVSWTDTEGVVYTDTMPPSEPYTNPRPSRVVEAQEGYETIVIFGVDARDNVNLIRGTQGDVIIIISIDKATGDMRLASVYRDFFFEFASGQFCKLADAYNRYGAEQVMAGLNRNLDLNITNFVAVNWAAEAELIDMLGGIDIEVTTEEATELDNFIYEIEVATGRKTNIKDWNYEPGLKHMDGIHAVAYSRIRKGNTGGDFARTERQRKIMSIILKEVKSLRNITTIVKIVEMVSHNIKTNMDSSQILDFAVNATRYRISDTVGFPQNPTSMDGQLFLVADNVFTQDVSDLHHFLYQMEDYEPSDNVKRIETAHQEFILTGYWTGPDN